MPLWHIHHHPSAFSADQKKELSDKISNIYHDHLGLPKFYAIVVFSPNEDIFIGGEPDKNFVRITMSHLARESKIDEKSARSFPGAVDVVLKPYIQDRGMSWEYSYDNSPRMFWKLMGWFPRIQIARWRKYGQKRTEQCHMRGTKSWKLGDQGNQDQTVRPGVSNFASLFKPYPMWRHLTSLIIEELLDRFKISSF